MKFTPDEWTPQVCTQLTKESDGTLLEEKPVAVEVVPVDTLPFLRTESTGSFTTSSSQSCSSRSTADTEASFLEDPSISFQALSLDQRPPTSVTVASSSSPNHESTEVAGAAHTHKRRIVKAIRISSSTSGTLPGVGSKAISGSEKASSQQDELPPIPRPAALTMLNRSKRQRGGSDYTTTNTTDEGSTSQATTSSSTDRHKRRRLHRNAAFVAQDFDSILLQLKADTTITGFL